MKALPTLLLTLALLSQTGCRSGGGRLLPWRPLWCRGGDTCRQETCHETCCAGCGCSPAGAAAAPYALPQNSLPPPGNGTLPE